MSRTIRLMTLAPGHHHAALVQKQMHPEVHRRVYVYAPVGEDLIAHMSRITAFNQREADATSWELDVRAGSNYLERYLREQPGTAVVIAGRNRTKIDLILAAVSNAAHVLADKPWIINADDFDKLVEVQRQAELRDLLVLDMMTERFEVTTMLLRDIIGDRDIFGPLQAGTRDQPALTLESAHYLKKQVDGALLRRPAWWFDAEEAGVGLADVGTHLADLSMWLLFPEQSIDYRSDVRVFEANQWPTPVSREQFRELTGLDDYPPLLKNRCVSGDLLLYQGNGSIGLTLRGAHVRLAVSWDYEAPAGLQDTQEVTAHGMRAQVNVRPITTQQGGYRPELFVTAKDADDHGAMFAAVGRRCVAWQARFPGVSAVDLGSQIQIVVPDRFHTDHEQHFAAVFGEFLRYMRNPRRVPTWENANLLAKYYITTTAARLARQKQVA